MTFQYVNMLRHVCAILRKFMHQIESLLVYKILYVKYSIQQFSLFHRAF